MTSSHTGWKTKTLGELCEIARGGSPRPIKSYLTEDPDGVNWIKIADATASSKYIYETKEKIKPEGIKRSRMVEEGDFILSNSMSFGRPYIMRTRGCIHDGWLVLKDKSGLFDQDYLYYFLGSPAAYSQFDSRAAGSTVRNLNIGLVESVEILLPSTPEQQRIVAILDAAFERIDAAIANTEKNLANARELFQSSLVSFFNSISTTRTKRLGEVTTFKGGGTPSKKEESYWGGDVLWVSPKDMKFDVITTSMDTITKTAISNSSVNLIPNGAVLIVVRSGILAHTIPIAIAGKELTVNQDIKAIVPSEGFDQNYVYYFLKAQSKIILEMVTRGATVHRLSANDLKDISIPVLDKADQLSIVQKCSLIADQAQQLESVYRRKLTALTELKQSILQKAFAGELTADMDQEALAI
jgi:type I restriction enzyme S subunit